jgi:CheY-like chemotaxis protein
MQASQRAATFTRQLLAFTRKQVLQARPLDLSVVVLRMKKMLSQLIGEKYEIQMDCPPGVPAVFADEGGMEQTLINLVLNARDAMPAGGVIRFESGLSVLVEAAANSNPNARAGRFVWLAVSDHGCGMNSELLARIFDPFFTTKDVGRGTGLGLSTIQGIVKQHEGWIEVASQVGRGSTFKVFLPVCDQAAAPPKANGVQRDSPSEPGKGETVLIVEDESAVRTLACVALKKRGYQVLDAADGHTALEVWKRSASHVDLLLTDMVMPGGMSGGALGKTLQSRMPQLKVIYTSGYSPEIMREDSLLAQDVNFLPKPYELSVLLKAVRLYLDGGKLPRCEVCPPKPEEAVMA